MSIPSDDASSATDFEHLHTGDTIEARQLDGLWNYHGEVDSVFPEMGILWIRHGKLRERKLLEAADYQLRRRPAPLT